MRVHFDIETRSRGKLKECGVYRYVQRDMDFRVLMAGFAIDGGPVEMFENHVDSTMCFQDLWHSGAEFVAHNAPFERICMSTAVGLPVGTYLDPERFVDTAARAVEAGFPRSLGNVAKALGASDKDDAGKALINWFCKPIPTGKMKGQFRRPEDHPEKWHQFVEYCRQDVTSLVDVDRLLPNWPTPMERRVFHADQRINDRGMRIDVQLAIKGKEAAEANALDQRRRVTEISGVENPNSLPQMKAFLEREGQPIRNMQAATVEKYLERTDLKPVVREVMGLRQELALTASKKYGSALAQTTDATLRGNLTFFGAHTGRWSGKGTQPHNLPRLAFDNPVDEMLAILDLFDGGRLSSEDLKRLVRALFLGPMTVVDYKSVEAIVIAWLAGETWVLEAVRAGRDIYVETANRMGGLTRSQGKIAVLALGYNGGAASIRALDVKGEFLHMSDDQLRKAFVIPWRKANPATVRLWAALGDAFGQGGRAGPRLRVTRGRDGLGASRYLHLPSGRSIGYHGVKWEQYVVTDEDPETGKVKRIRKEGFRYADPSNPFNGRIGTYGGRLAENATQAVARDLLAEALVRLEEHGLDVAAHVHDEILVYGEHSVEKVKAIMCKVPRWAAGLPIDGDGKQVKRYRKI
jgi:DNA polymerase